MAKRFKAAVIGGTGYGGELIRRLHLRREVVGEPLANPHLEGRTDGLGPRGKGFHTQDEQIEAVTLVKQAEALARLVLAARSV